MNIKTADTYMQMPANPNSEETIEWFESLGRNEKLEAILAGHVISSPFTRPADPVLTILQPYEVVVTNNRSTLLKSCHDKLKLMIRSSSHFISNNSPRVPQVTATPYRSPSPEASCCGIIYSPDPPDVFYV